METNNLHHTKETKMTDKKDEKRNNIPVELKAKASKELQDEILQELQRGDPDKAKAEEIVGSHDGKTE